MPNWVWNMEWELQPDPIPGQFQEVACFERPVSSQHKRHNADIVCGVEFSPDGWFLASAGVTKQVRLLFITHVYSSAWNAYWLGSVGSQLISAVADLV